MAETSLYWHDYETFGVDPRRDAPAQFAGLRTDLDFNVVGGPMVLYCRPPTDRLPAPEACLLTGITPFVALAEGICEADFIRAIHGELAKPGTCGLGYNTLRFDDEVTRNTLYRNLYDPYEREWKSGNSRWDIIDMVRLAAALRPEGIEWPVDAAGRPCFRLELLTQANNISHTGAHDALADVHATIALARLVKHCQPRLYDFVWRHRGKHEAADLLKLGSFEPVLHVSEKYPAERGCIAVVVALARHPVNHNEIAVFDLSADPRPLLDLDAEEIRKRLFTRVADLPEGMGRIPMKTVHINRCPILVPMNTLRTTDAERLSIDLSLCFRHLELIKNGKDLVNKLAAVFTKPAGLAEPDDPDLMIYSGGFFNGADKQKLARLRDMGPSQLALTNPSFDDPRLPEMLFRYRARNWPESLTTEEHDRWERFRLSRLNGIGGGGGEYEERLAQLEIQAGLESKDKDTIAQLREWGRAVAAFNPNPNTILE
jgi:exodeoxyribonuclease-1